MMRYFTLLILAFFLCTVSVAQSTNSIVLDRGSFRAVQTDALTGVNIDPISTDSRRQPCARVKIKFDRMSRAQVDALQVKLVTNNELTKQKVATYYDNVLIIEITAKANTRVYFASPELGVSNEITVDLEPNVEYQMLASLRDIYTILVQSNTPDAEVYLDGNFKGKTDSSSQLYIAGVGSGEHTLKLQFGGESTEQRIVVSGNNILFRQDIARRYKIGDYYDFNGLKGVVFEVSRDGRHGKIVSLNQSDEQLSWTVDAKEQRRKREAVDTVDGAKNISVIAAVEGWQSKYPAFKWCAEQGEGWYLPAIDELKSFVLNDKAREAINQTLKAQGGVPIFGRSDKERYWSSTECYEKMVGEYSAWAVRTYINVRTENYANKSDYMYVRAVAVF